MAVFASVSVAARVTFVENFYKRVHCGCCDALIGLLGLVGCDPAIDLHVLGTRANCARTCHSTFLYMCSNFVERSEDSLPTQLLLANTTAPGPCFDVLCCAVFVTVYVTVCQEYYSLDGQSKWANLGYVCCFFLFFL
jgi:hypothetical protein